MKGSYILLAELADRRDILVGKLGCITFPKAFYAYVGSAMSGFRVRLTHHLRKEKKPHWHIDYLLNEAAIVDIILCPGEQKMECLLAQALAREFQFIPGFGSSDCHCNSHLYFDADLDKLKAGGVAAGKSILSFRGAEALTPSHSVILSVAKNLTQLRTSSVKGKNLISLRINSAKELR